MTGTSSPTIAGYFHWYGVRERFWYYRWKLPFWNAVRVGSFLLEILYVYSTLIEMFGEFFLIYDEGRRCKVIYDENIFPHIWRKIPLDFP
jgi:hypothetical protein